MDDMRIVKEDIRVRVSLPRCFSLRSWLTFRLLMVAGLIAPFAIEVDVAPRAD